MVAGSVVVRSDLNARRALALAEAGTPMLWRDDYHQARQLLAAMKRRFERARPARRPPDDDGSTAAVYLRERQAVARRAHLLATLLVELGPGNVLDLPRAPDVREAATQAFGASDTTTTIPLTRLVGALGAHQWRLRGIEIPALGGRVHPHYGVFAPTRTDYVDLVAAAPLPRRGAGLAFDVGTGTGVLPPSWPDVVWPGSSQPTWTNERWPAPATPRPGSASRGASPSNTPTCSPPGGPISSSRTRRGCRWPRRPTWTGASTTTVATP